MRLSLMSKKTKLKTLFSLYLIVFLLCLSGFYFFSNKQLINSANGYVTPQDAFFIPTGSKDATLDAIKDSNDDYPSTITEDGAMIDMWVYYYNNYLYWYIEVPSDTVNSDNDNIDMCFERGHDGALTNDEEKGFVLQGNGASGVRTYTSDAWSWSGTFDFTGTDGLQGGKRTWELKLLASDCGWTSGGESFGLWISSFNDDATWWERWPDDNLNDLSNIDEYGEVLGAISEFQTSIVPIIAFMVVVAGILFIRQRKT